MSENIPIEEDKDHYSENYKTPKKAIEESKRRWKNSPMVILWDKNIVKLPYCKKIYRF